MAQKKGKRTLVTTVSILVVLLVAIGTVALVKLVNPGKQDPYLQQETSSTSDNSTDSDTNTSDTSQNQTDETADADTSVSGDTEEQSTLDPATVSTLDITPMSITVSYVKGIGGFEYEVLRANNGTRYVEFRSASLVGTKCTNDAGTFASIIANPTESERTALTKTTTVDGTLYGLSLADVTCTSDAGQLQKYQKSFSDAFSLLKKID